MCYEFKFNKTEEPSGGVVEWFKALVLKAIWHTSICKRSKEYLKSGLPQVDFYYKFMSSSH